jgi:hypothetical protein
MGKYAKAVIATLVAIAGALVTALGTSPQQNLAHLSTVTWLTAIGAILASGAITWWTQNVQGVAGGIIKAVVASAGAFITALITAYSDNVVSQAELIGAISAALVALAAVYQVKNTA